MSESLDRRSLPPDNPEQQKERESQKEADRYLKLARENPHAISDEIKNNPKTEPFLKKLLWDTEYERIKSINPNTLKEDTDIAKMQKEIYSFAEINPDTDRNSTKNKFIKGLIDSIIVENVELAKQIIETRGKMLLDMISHIFSWEWLKQIAEWLKTSVMGIFSGDAYKAWKSTWELGLITTGAWLGVAIWKKWLKEVLRVTGKESIRDLTWSVTEWVQSKVRKIVSEVAIPVSVATKRIDDIPAREMKKTPTHIEKQAPTEVPLHPRFSEVQKSIRKTLWSTPEIASIVEKYLLDEKSVTNLRNFLRNPETRDVVLKNIKDIVSAEVISPEQLQWLVKKSLESKNPLMQWVDAEFSTLNGEKKTAILSRDLKSKNPELFSIGENPTIRQKQLLAEYVRVLQTEWQGTLRRTLKDIAWEKRWGFPEVNVRAKSAEGVLDKISRMRKWNDGKPPRPEYDLSQMPDILWGRITVTDIKDLDRVMQGIETHFGKAKIIERDNFYSNPIKSQNPYRAITYTVEVLIDWYPAEIQLTTLKASISADLYHNTIYKTLVPTSANEKSAIESFRRQATAIELRELQ